MDSEHVRVFCNISWEDNCRSESSKVRVKGWGDIRKIFGGVVDGGDAYLLTKSYTFETSLEDLCCQLLLFGGGSGISRSSGWLGARSLVVVVRLRLRGRVAPGV